MVTKKKKLLFSSSIVVICYFIFLSKMAENLLRITELERMYILGNTMHDARKNFFQPNQRLGKTLGKNSQAKGHLVTRSRYKGERVFGKGSARERASSRR
jgi:hypothetical protein